jgi:hypothetical protein
MKSGRLWVLGLLAVGAALALGAVLYWKRPSNSVRWSFTNFHAAVLRGKRDQALRLCAPKVSWHGKEHSDRDFAAAYALPAMSGEIEALPCAAQPAHWDVRMNDLVYCFDNDAGGTLWRLHRVGTQPCGCK